jgi:transcriptional regulator with XRE-family HTH domain
MPKRTKRQGPPTAGNRLREIREASGLSQEELAARADYDKTTISKVEAGVAAPSFGLLIRLVRVLRTDADNLFPELRYEGGAADAA